MPPPVRSTGRHTPPATEPEGKRRQNVSTWPFPKTGDPQVYTYTPDPTQSHALSPAPSVSKDHAILRAQTKTYEAAKRKHPDRWHNRNVCNCSPIGTSLAHATCPLFVVGFVFQSCHPLRQSGPFRKIKPCGPVPVRQQHCVPQLRASVSDWVWRYHTSPSGTAALTGS